MSETKLNLELFQKVRERIATIPESYNQSRWIVRKRTSPCGYAACLAGETIICAAPTVEAGIRKLNRMMKDEELEADYAIPNLAGELLGLDGDYRDFQSEYDIFTSTADRWPEPFKAQFLGGDQSGAAVAYLDWIIANNRIFPE